ncbi:MAG TPA: hypothetical protein DCK76_04465 [Desulfotomaculum sp.]|nr:hypothetical protein [Desulfotomaculum sp.]
MSPKKIPASGTNSSTAITTSATLLCRAPKSGTWLSLPPDTWPPLAFPLPPGVWRKRDDFIGWSAKRRMQNLHLVVNNSRFLILPWVNFLL